MSGLTRWRGVRGWTAAVLAAVGLAALSPSPSQAAPGDGYATWTFTGASRVYSGTVTLAQGFPATTLTSDSRAPAALNAGANVWIPAGTPFGSTFGSSTDKPYLSLRPRADNAASPSTTTYAFASPTPVGPWGVVLGDIDAEALTITALGANGAPVAGADLGVTRFNYCNATPRSSTCTGQTAPYALPAVVVGATSVAANDNCPAVPAQCETTGASVWVNPLVPLTSLTVVSSWRQGLPQYQTWFASAAWAVSGQVTTPCAPLPAGTSVELVGPDGSVVAGTSPTGTGAYQFSSILAQAGYAVRVIPAVGSVTLGAATQPVDLSTADRTGVDFAVALTQAVSGRVVETGGAPLAGAVVALLSGTTVVANGTTGGDGSYAFPTVTPGSYTIAVTSPTGFEDPPPEPVAVACAAVGVPDIVVTTSPTTEPPTSTTTTEPTTTTATSTSSTTTSAAPPPASPPTSSLSPSTTTAAPVGTGSNTGSPDATLLAATGTNPTLPLAFAGVLVLVGTTLLLGSSRLRRRPPR